MRSIAQCAWVAMTIIFPAVGSSGNVHKPAQKSSPAAATSPYRTYVDMLTFMEHVVTPAANIIWNASGSVSDQSGIRDLTPRTTEQWENVTSGAATLAEVSNALLIPQRRLDPAWNSMAQELGRAAEEAYQAAEKHDAKGVSDVAERLDGICSNCHKHYGFE